MTHPYFDVVLRNGLIVDGTGGPTFAADVGIVGDRIARIGSLHGESAVLDIEPWLIIPPLIHTLTEDGQTNQFGTRAAHATRSA